MDSCIVAVLAFWYGKQEVCVRWHNTYSSNFLIGNGIRQGGILSPVLFARYMHDLLKKITDQRIGCNLGGVFYNILAYADRAGG